MKKKEIIEQIRAVYKYNVRWQVAVHAKILDLPTTDKITDLAAPDCEFAKWHDENTEKLSHLKPFENLGRLHEKSHWIYDSIEKLQDEKKRKKVGFLDKLLGRDELIDVKMINAHYKDLTNTTNKMQNNLRSLERNIREMSNKQFEKVKSLSKNTEKKEDQIFIDERDEKRNILK